MKRVLAVDDERAAREYLRVLLANENYDVVTAENGVDALVVLERGGVDLVLSDLHMPEMDGAELLTHVVQRWPGLPVIMVTAASDAIVVTRVVVAGPEEVPAH